MKRLIHRRTALSLLAGSSLALARPGWGQGGIGGTGIDAGLGGTGIDAGIGGTGIDGGIGGTGIFGLIEGFSSIWVNDVRVEIPETALITLNGRVATEADLALGQTVAVEAQEDATGTLQASRIDAAFALVGPIERSRMDRGRLILHVLKQVVVVSELSEVPDLRLGDWVVVTGLRDHRGHIQAANVATTDSREAVITGPVSDSGRVAGVDIVLDVSGGQALIPGTRATVQGPLTEETRRRIVATSIITRPLAVFDASRVGALVLTGLPGEQDGTLVVDGFTVNLPGVTGQADPGTNGIRGRVHGRFELNGGRYRPKGGPFASKQPRAPFEGSGRKGPGQSRPLHHHQQRGNRKPGSHPPPHKNGPKPSNKR